MEILTYALIIIGGAATTPENFAPYLDSGVKSVVATEVFLPDINPFTADHVRDYSLLQKRLAVIEANHPGVKFLMFGFSIGGKHAARFAKENPENVAGLFLVDPVDGGPPVVENSKKFPVFIPKSIAPYLDTVTRIVESEFGGAPGFAGQACVTAKYGPDHFAQAITEGKLERFTLQGASHTDMLARPVTFFARFVCAKGTAQPSDTLSKTKSLWQDFAQRVTQ